MPAVEGQQDLMPDEGCVSALHLTIDQVTAMARDLPSDAPKEEVRRILWSLPCLRQQDADVRANFFLAN